MPAKPLPAARPAAMQLRKLILLLIPLMLACSLVSKATPTPRPTLTFRTPTPTSRPTPDLTCNEVSCIRNIYVTLGAENMYLALDLADQDNQVLYGSEPTVAGLGKLEVYLKYKTYESSQEVYLFGGEFADSDLECYIGNDLPWAYGFLGSACTLSYPINRMQIRPHLGDTLRVDIPRYRRSEYVTILARLPSAPGALSLRPTEVMLSTDTPLVELTLPAESETPPAPLETPLAVTDTPTATSNPLLPSETASTGGSSHTIGELVPLNGQNIVLTDVEVASDVLKANYTIENMGAEPITIVSALLFTAKNEDGSLLGQSLSDCEPALDGSIASGERMEGVVCFNGPFSAAVSLYYQPAATGDAPVLWQVSSAP